MSIWGPKMPWNPADEFIGNVMEDEADEATIVAACRQQMIDTLRSRGDKLCQDAANEIERLWSDLEATIADWETAMRLQHEAGRDERRDPDNINYAYSHGEEVER